MKTLAVIKNELFKDYLKIVSTENLEKTLDNPDVPVPFTCLDSVENNSSDELATQLSQYFEQAKVKNKEFYVLDETQTGQLQFMLNLIKISSGENVVEASKPMKPLVEKHPETQIPKLQQLEQVEAPIEVLHVSPETENSIAELSTEEPPEYNIPHVSPASSLIEPENEELEEEDPFLIKEEPQKTTMPSIEEDEFDPFKVPEKKSPVVEVTEPKVEEELTVFGVPKNATIHFAKNDMITATLVDDKNVVFEGTQMSLLDAAKLAFKQSGRPGISTGAGNWQYLGQTLKVVK